MRMCGGLDCRNNVVKHKMDHLSCFIPAMLALGAHHRAVPPEKAARYLQVTSLFWQRACTSYICDGQTVMGPICGVTVSNRALPLAAGHGAFRLIVILTRTEFPTCQR